LAQNATFIGSMYNGNLTSIISNNKCSSTALIKVLENNQSNLYSFQNIYLFLFIFKEFILLCGKCFTQFDAYYLIAVIFVSIGFLWVILNRKRVIKLNEIPSSEWKVFDEIES